MWFTRNSWYTIAWYISSCGSGSFFPLVSDGGSGSWGEVGSWQPDGYWGWLLTANPQEGPAGGVLPCLHLVRSEGEGGKKQLHFTWQGAGRGASRCTWNCSSQLEIPALLTDTEGAGLHSWSHTREILSVCSITHFWWEGFSTLRLLRRILENFWVAAEESKSCNLDIWTTNLRSDRLQMTSKIFVVYIKNKN